jgi:hypothetical protein
MRTSASQRVRVYFTGTSEVRRVMWDMASEMVESLDVLKSRIGTFCADNFPPDAAGFKTSSLCLGPVLHFARSSTYLQLASIARLLGKYYEDNIRALGLDIIRCDVFTRSMSDTTFTTLTFRDREDPARTFSLEAIEYFLGEAPSLVRCVVFRQDERARLARDQPRAPLFRLHLSFHLADDALLCRARDAVEPGATSRGHLPVVCWWGAR